MPETLVGVPWKGPRGCPFDLRVRHVFVLEGLELTATGCGHRGVGTDRLARGNGLIGKLSQELLADRCRIHVSDDGDGHVFRSIPRPAVTQDRLGRSVADHVEAANREALGVRRTVVEHGNYKISDTPADIFHPQAPFLQHDFLFILQDRGRDPGPMRPVVENLQSGQEGLGFVGRQDKKVLGAGEAGAGVEVGAELHAVGLKEIDDGLGRKVLGTLKFHMFEQVGNSPLLFGLLNTARVNQQTELNPMLRPRIGLDKIGDPIREHAGQDVGR